MFEKIFTYSSIDKKENHVAGVLDAIKLMLFIFPAAGLIIGLFSCYIVYLDDIIYKRVYYLVAVLLMAVLMAALIRWVREMFMVYAISNDGRLYRFKMFQFAMGYLGLGSKAGEIAGMGMGRLQSTFELMMKIKKTIEKLDNEQQITEMFAGGYAVEFYDIKVIKRNEYGVKAAVSYEEKGREKRARLRIRKVYSDWENLFHYMEYISDNKSGSMKDFHFTKKTTYDDFVVNKPSYIKRIGKQSFWIITIAAWLGVLTLSSDINKQSKINEGLYVKADARILSVDNQGKKSQKITIGYQADGVEYDKTIQRAAGHYEAGEDIELYYKCDNPEKNIMFGFEEHINYKPLLIIVLFCEIIIFVVNVDFKRKSS